MRTSILVVVAVAAFGTCTRSFAGPSESSTSPADGVGKNVPDFLTREILIKREIFQCLNRLGARSFKFRRMATRRLIEIAGSGPLPPTPGDEAGRAQLMAEAVAWLKKQEAESKAATAQKKKEEGVEKVVNKPVAVSDEASPMDARESVMMDQVRVALVVGPVDDAEIGGIGYGEQASKIFDLKEEFPYKNFVMETARKLASHDDPEVAARSREVVSACEMVGKEYHRLEKAKKKKARVDERW